MAVSRRSTPVVIVVMEPNVFLRYSIVESLHNRGRTLLHAASLDEVLRVIRKSRTPVDLVLLSVDFSDPHELEMCREISAQNPAIKLVVMADLLSVQRRARAENWFAIPKPFRTAALRQKVRSVLAGKASRGTVRKR